ncbi:hypothetical protein Zmor_009449 [Zophobas morio]|uniref:Uncharacterized protein n=1 Tax=Zophobas morio TaxID=2755281 RepID=A0AA38IIU1_9CUCU|nr:hypothetical protein Zmor_009449 [Zophobas morio]
MAIITPASGGVSPFFNSTDDFSVNHNCQITKVIVKLSYRVPIKTQMTTSSAHRFLFSSLHPHYYLTANLPTHPIPIHAFNLRISTITIRITTNTSVPPGSPPLPSSPRRFLRLLPRQPPKAFLDIPQQHRPHPRERFTRKTRFVVSQRMI